MENKRCPLMMAGFTAKHGGYEIDGSAYNGTYCTSDCRWFVDNGDWNKDDEDCRFIRALENIVNIVVDWQR